MIRFATVALLAPIATPAFAAPVSIMVRTADGAPLAGAVVTVELPGVPAPRVAGPYLMEQRDIQFQPRLLIVPVGASVGFPNRDRVRHHVYSFSKAKRFDLKLYGREEARTVTFDKPGAVTLGCNIHDRMNGVVFVTATPFAAVTDGAGHVAFDTPTGAATLRVWHPAIRAPGNGLAKPLAIGRGGGGATIVVP